MWDDTFLKEKNQSAVLLQSTERVVITKSTKIMQFALFYLYYTCNTSCKNHFETEDSLVFVIFYYDK